MSRSGTWYNREFFFFFNELLSNKSKDQIIDEFVLEKKIKYLIKVKKNILILIHLLYLIGNVLVLKVIIEVL